MELELVESCETKVELKVGDIVEITWSNIGKKFNLVMKIEGKYRLRNVDGISYTAEAFDSLSDMEDYLDENLDHRIFPQHKFKLKLEEI